MNEELTITNNLVAANIRKSRLFRNYSQDYLAQCLGISQNAYSKLELGYTEVTINRLFHVARILDVSLTELLDINQVPVPASFWFKQVS